VKHSTVCEWCHFINHQEVAWEVYLTNSVLRGPSVVAELLVKYLICGKKVVYCQSINQDILLL